MIINLQNLEEIRKNNPHKKIVFASGTFDLTHAGHILFFEDCKKFGDMLVIGVGGDSITKQRKGGNRPILNESIRLKTIDSLKPVDFSFIDNISTHENKLALIEAVFEKLKPDFYVINDDAFDIETRKKICSKSGVEIKIIGRWCPPEFQGISTSNIIEKIRNLDDDEA